MDPYVGAIRFSPGSTCPPHGRGFIGFRCEVFALYLTHLTPIRNTATSNEVRIYCNWGAKKDAPEIQALSLCEAKRISIFAPPGSAFTLRLVARIGSTHIHLSPISNNAAGNRSVLIRNRTWRDLRISVRMWRKANL